MTPHEHNVVEQKVHADDIGAALVYLHMFTAHASSSLSSASTRGSPAAKHIVGGQGNHHNASGNLKQRHRGQKGADVIEAPSGGAWTGAGNSIPWSVFLTVSE
jgi:hypothetical protein